MDFVFAFDACMFWETIQAVSLKFCITICIDLLSLIVLNYCDLILKQQQHNKHMQTEVAFYHWFLSSEDGTLHDC